MRRITFLVFLTFIACSTAEDMNLANTEWRYYHNSSDFDYIKFKGSSTVTKYSAESMNTFAGTYSIDGSSVFIIIDKSDNHHWNENDKKKSKMKMKDGQLRYLKSWKFNPETKEYETTNFIFDPNYIFKKQE